MSTTTTPPVALDSSTRLAVDRTRLAYERTLMAWVRTSASLISFGFTIYKFFQLDLRGRPEVSPGLLGPREFALALIAMGLASLVLSTIQHRQTMQRFRADYGTVIPWSTAAALAALFSAFGLTALIAVWLRL